ncbi:hypothetical protein IT417_02855 [bacterium]|nr:hypothetical protein [bacterium]
MLAAPGRGELPSFENLNISPESAEELGRDLRKTLEALVTGFTGDSGAAKKLLESMLDPQKEQAEGKVPERTNATPLLSEQKGVKKVDNGLEIEITSPAVKEAFIGPNGRSLTEDMFQVIAGRETQVSAAGKPGNLNSGLSEVKSVTLGGANVKTGFDRLELSKGGDKGSPNGNEVLTFVKLDPEGKPDPKKSVSIRIERTQNDTSGIPDSKVILSLGLQETSNAITDSIGNIPTRLSQVEYLLKFKPDLSLQEKDDLSAEAALLREQTVTGLNAESRQANQALLFKDLASIIAIARERGHSVTSRASMADSNESVSSRQFQALEVFNRIIETPGSLINRSKKAEKRSGDVSEDQKLSDLKSFINKVRADSNGEVPDQTPRQEVPTPLGGELQTSNTKKEAPKSIDELKKDFEGELSAIKDLRKRKEDLEAEIKALSSADAGTLSVEEKKKLESLQKDLDETKRGLEILKSLGDIQLFDRKKSLRDKLKNRFQDEIDSSTVLTPEQISKLSVSDLLRILTLNAQYASKKDSTPETAEKDKQNLDKINALIGLVNSFSEANPNAVKESKGKDKKKAIDLLTEWLTARETSLSTEIDKLNTAGATLETTNKEREEKLAALKKELEKLDVDFAATQLKAASSLRSLGDQIPTDEWIKLSSALHEASFGDLPENPEDTKTKTEAAANASIASNCLRHIDLELEQRIEPETSKVKKFFKRAAEVLTSVFGGIAARTAVKAIITGTLGLALGGPAGLLLGGVAGALAGGASSAIFSTWMHYKVFHNDKLHALYAENANPGKYDFFRSRIFDKANETYGVKARIQNIATVYNQLLSGQLKADQLTPDLAKTVLSVVKDAKMLKNTTNFIGVNNLGLDANLFKNAAGETVLPEDALRDFALKFDNFVNNSINAGKLNTDEVSKALSEADSESKTMVNAMIASASWTKFFKGALIGGASGLIAQGIGNALEGKGFLGTETGGVTNSAVGSVTESQMSDADVLKFNEEAMKRLAPYGQQQVALLHQNYSNVPEADLQKMFTQFDVNGNGILEGTEANALVDSLNQSGSTGGVPTLVGAWDAPYDGNISKDVPPEWVDTWTKAIYNVGRGHDFHGAQFSMQGAPGGDYYALGRALDYMSKHVPAESMNTPEAGISVSHLYGHLLLGGQPTDAQLAEFLTRVDAKYEGTDYDISKIFTGSGEAVTSSTTNSSALIAGMNQITTAAQNDVMTLWSSMAESPTITETVSNSVANFVVDTTKGINELGTSGALAGMGVSMWLANMYTPENREYAKVKEAGKEGDKSGTPPANQPGNSSTSAGSTTQKANNTPGSNSADQTVETANRNSGLTDISAASAKQGSELKPFGKIESAGVGLSADSENTNPNVVNINAANGRFVASTPVWVKSQTGNVSQFAYRHPRLAELYKEVLYIGNFIKQYAKTTVGMNNDPFEAQVLADITKSVAANDKYAVRRHDGGAVSVASSQVYNLDPYRARQNELTAGQNLRELNESVRQPLAKFVKKMLEVEFGAGGLGQQHLGDIDRGVLDLYMKDGGEKYINNEQVHAFLALLMVLNDPENMEPKSKFLNQKGTQEFNGIVNVMISRESAWMSMLSPKLNGQNYLGSAFLVSDGIIRSALEMSGYNVKPDQREARQYFTNVDQIARSVALVKGGSPYSNALQLVNLANQNGVEYFALMREATAKARAEKKGKKKKQQQQLNDAVSAVPTVTPQPGEALQDEPAREAVVVGTNEPAGTDEI